MTEPRGQAAMGDLYFSIVSDDVKIGKCAYRSSLLPHHGGIHSRIPSTSYQLCFSSPPSPPSRHRCCWRCRYREDSCKLNISQKVEMHLVSADPDQANAICHSQSSLLPITPKHPPLPCTPSSHFFPH